VIAWQVTLCALLVAAAVSVLASVLSMPRTGYKCDLCDDVTCQSFFGWRCSAAANRQGFCEIRVFPDSSAVLVCPSREEIEIEAVNGNFALLDVDAECDERCGAGGPPVSSAQPPPSSGGGGGGSDTGDGTGGGAGGAAEPAPGSFQPIEGLLGPLPSPGGDGDDGGSDDDDSDGDDGGAPPGGGGQFIDPTTADAGSGGDDVGATSR